MKNDINKNNLGTTTLDTNILRIIATIAVVFIHGTSQSELNFHQNPIFCLNSDFIAILLNQLARFSVPCFFILSGFGLTMSYIKKTKLGQKFNYNQFYKNRFSKVIYTYLLVSFVFGVFRFNFNFTTLNSLEGWKTLIQLYFDNLLYGKGDFHLYFLVLIIQFYLFFPLFIRLPSIISLIIFLGLQVYLAHPTRNVIKEIFPALSTWKLKGFPNTFFLSWSFYFMLGIFSAKHLYSLKKWTNIFRWPILILTFGFTIIIIIEYIHNTSIYKFPYFYNHFNRLTVILYSSFIWFSFIAFSKTMLNLKNNIIANAITRFLYQNSLELIFAIYIYHTWFQRLLNPYFSNTILLSSTVFVLTFIICFLLNQILKRWDIRRNLKNKKTNGLRHLLGFS